ncbi:MAG: hypothetical protein CMN64_09935 [Sphingobium sp.]|nr:hypothetical protein [Sphingobium sp.]
MTRLRGLVRAGLVVTHHPVVHLLSAMIHAVLMGGRRRGRRRRMCRCWMGGGRLGHDRAGGEGSGREKAEGGREKCRLVHGLSPDCPPPHSSRPASSTRQCRRGLVVDIRKLRIHRRADEHCSNHAGWTVVQGQDYSRSCPAMLSTRRFM